MSSDAYAGQQTRQERLQRSSALIDLRRYSQALAELAPLLAGDDSEALCRAAQALLALDRHEEAAVMAGRAIAANPAREWPHRIRSRALMEAGQKASGPERDRLLHDAVESAREAARLAPAQALTMRSAAEVERAAGNYPAAAAAIHAAIGLDPQAADPWVVDGLIALDEGDSARAERSNRHAISLDPGQATAWNNLGVALQRQGRWREATAAYVASARLNPPDSLVQGNVARLGLLILRMAALLALIPVLFIPYGAVAYVVLLAAGSFLCRPGGRFRGRAETLGIKTALRTERLPLQRRLTQVLGLQLVYRFVVMLVVVAFISTSGLGMTPSGVSAAAVVALLVVLFWRAIRAGLRSRH